MPASGRKPDEQEKVICPNSRIGKEYAPHRVWVDSKGRLVGEIAKHVHPRQKREDCAYSGHVVPVKRTDKKE